jgi:tetratricopeptide (TPR) repeat protein
MQSREQFEKNKLTGSADDFFIIENNVLPPPPAKPNKKLASRLNNQGAHLLNQQQTDKIEPAIALFTQAIETFHTATEFYNRAKAYYFSGQFNLAYEDIQACRQLPANESTNVGFCLLHGEILEKLGKLTEANEQFSSALTIALKAAEENRDNSECHRKVGAVYYTMQNFVEAEASFTRAIDCEPYSNLCGKYIDRAQARLRQKKLVETLSDYQAIISLLGEFQSPQARRLTQMLLHTLYHTETNDALAEGCYQAYELQLSHGHKKESMIDLILACKHNPNHPTAGKKLEAVLEELDKSEIVEIISLQSRTLQIHLFKECLDHDSRLGKRIWKPEGVTFCDISTGTLNFIVDRLSELQPVLIQRGFFKSGTREALIAHEVERRNLPVVEHSYDGFNL